MAGKYDDLAAQIVELIGGKSNVKSVAHCITRVRFKLKDESLANDEKISELPNVIKVMRANGQYQVVVGNIVEDVYDAVSSEQPSCFSTEWVTSSSTRVLFMMKSMSLARPMPSTSALTIWSAMLVASF